MEAPRSIVPVQNALPTPTSRAAIIASLTVLAAFSVLTWVVSPVTGGVYTGCMTVLVVSRLGLNRREAQRFARENNEANAALARGELEKAHDVFRDWSINARMVRAAALARHNLAWTLLRMGQHEDALAVFLDNDTHNQGALKAIALDAVSAVDIALTHALVGDMAAAQTWLRTAELRSAHHVVPRLPALRAFAQAVIDCRSGLAADAARMLAEGWGEYEGTLTGDTMRPLRVVRAFAIAQAGPREAGQAETLVAMSRPSYPREYAFLGTRWPEMASFLAAHDLAPRALAASS